MLAAAERIEDGFKAVIGEDWLQGRTAYGGLSAALAYEAARRAADALPPLRSAQVTFIGPLAGPVTATARLLRQGRNASFVAAELSTGHGLGLSATFCFMRALDSHVALSERPAPTIEGPTATAIPEQAVIPRFLDNFDIAPVESFARSGGADLLRWFRVKDREGLDAMTELVLVGDGMPPAVMPLMTRPAPISSLTWLFNVLTPEPMTTDGWWLLRAESDYAHAGAANQGLSCWNRGGELVSRGMQAVALFG